jgi:N utilization substance protein A
LERREEGQREERRALGVEDALAELPHLTEAMLVTLGKAGIKTLDDLADLATDELIARKRASSAAATTPAATVRNGRKTRAACWANMA